MVKVWNEPDFAIPAKAGIHRIFRVLTHWQVTEPASVAAFAQYSVINPDISSKPPVDYLDVLFLRD
jgi:hypothetical protein